jgi:hypothetical protein
LSGASGGWAGIYFGPYSEPSSFERCLIEKGGEGGYNVMCSSAPSVEFQTSQIRHSSAAGIYTEYSATTVSRCDISNNGTAGVYVGQSPMPIMGGDPMHCNRLCENGTYDVYLASSTDLDASYNWWCSTDPAFIADRIYDGNDGGGPGIVTFEPFSEEPCLDNNPVEHFSLLSPGNGEMVATLTPTFSWEEAIDPDVADSVRYRLVISEDDLFTVPIVYDHLSDTTYTVPVELPDNTSFWWKVIAYDQALLETPSNETWTFTANIPPSVPEPIVPIGGEMVGEAGWLVWFASEDPGGAEVTYHIQVADNESFVDPVIDETGLSLAAPLPGFAGGDPAQAGPAVRIVSLEGIPELAPSILTEGSVHPAMDGGDQGDAFAVRLGSLSGAENLVNNTTYYWRVQALDNHGAESGFSDGSARFIFVPGSALPADGRVPSEVFLSRGMPNPFAQTILIEFGMPGSGAAAVQVFDNRGRLVRVLAGGNHAPGIHRITWDGRGDGGAILPNGIYFCRLDTGGAVKTTKLVLMRE